MAVSCLQLLQILCLLRFFALSIHSLSPRGLKRFAVFTSV